MLSNAQQTAIQHKTVEIDGVNVFYREAGQRGNPVVVLLHGFPTSSHMFRRLIPALADRYHVLAPDYPGFGFSDMPSRESFSYTFANYADLVRRWLERLNARNYTLYVMDYGAPVGFRLALAHPERIRALIIQNGNAYEAGLSPFWDQLKAYWSTGGSHERNALRPLMSLDVTKFQYLDGASNPGLIDPACWTLDQALLDRPGNIEIQLDLFFDYQHNVALYPQFHEYFRSFRPPALIAWGAKDSIFPEAGARAFLKDLPHAQLRLMESGHFALEDQFEVMAPLIRDFLATAVKPTFA